jgi:hypothetical protein
VKSINSIILVHYLKQIKTKKMRKTLMILTMGLFLGTIGYTSTVIAGETQQTEKTDCKKDCKKECCKDKKKAEKTSSEKKACSKKKGEKACCHKKKKKS